MALLAIHTAFAVFAVLLFIILSSIFSKRVRRFFALLVLSQLPTLLMTFLGASAFQKTLNSSWIFLTFECLLFLFFLAGAYFTAYHLSRRWKIIPRFSFQQTKPLFAFLGFFLLLTSEMLVSTLQQLFLLHPQTTSNQAALNHIALQIPPFIFILTVVSAGFFEELVFRVGVFELLFKNVKNRYWPALVSVILFTLIHSPTDVFSSLTYGLLALILTGFYLRFKNFYLNMGMHMLLNLTASSLFYLSLILQK